MTSTSTVEGIIEIAGHIREQAKRHLEEDGYVAPLAYLFLRKDLETGEPFLEPAVLIVQPETLANSVEKDLYATFLRRAAKTGNSVAVLILMEVWTMYGTEEEIRGSQSLESFPGRRETVSLSLEHQDLHGGVLWLAEILRDENHSPRLGP
jgi:hypothetical protein